MMLALLLMLAADPFAAARGDIDIYCKGQGPSQAFAACVAEQRDAMARFVTIMAAFDDPGGEVAKKCMTDGKSGRHINWLIAKRCMQSAAKGKPLGGTLTR
jgi:hypothetical protein